VITTKTRPFYSITTLFMYNLNFECIENVPKGKGFIIASNHQSYMDPIFLTM